MLSTPVSRRAQIIAALIAVLAVVALATVTAVTFTAHDGEKGTDSHVQLDPVADPQTAAVDIMAGLHTWSPATQSSPWDAMQQMSSRLTGRMAVAAATRPDPDPTPRQWEAWARANDRVIGTGALATTDPRDGQDTQVVVTVRQVVLHQGGETTPREDIVLRVHMVHDNQMWKAEYFEAIPMIERGQ